MLPTDSTEAFYYYYYNCYRFTAPWTVSGTTRVSLYQKGKTNVDLLEQEIVNGSGISWDMQICTLPQTDNHASIPALSFLQPGCPSSTQPTASKH